MNDLPSERTLRTEKPLSSFTTAHMESLLNLSDLLSTLTQSMQVLSRQAVGLSFWTQYPNIQTDQETSLWLRQMESTLDLGIQRLTLIRTNLERGMREPKTT